MKKIKKIMAMLLAMVMVLGMTVTASAAGRTGKISVIGNGINDKAKITYGKIVEENRESIHGWKFVDSVKQTFVDAWNKKANTKLDADGVIAALIELGKVEKIKNNDYAESGLTNPNAVFAAALEAVVGSATEELAESNTNEKGLYVVNVENEGYTFLPMAAYINVAKDDVTIQAKGFKNQINKTVEDTGNSVAPGDEVNYTIKEQYLYIKPNAGSKEFTITDTLTNGTFKEGSLKVELWNRAGDTKEKDLTTGDYTVSEYGNTSTFTVNFGGEKYNSSYAGKTVVITYTAIAGAVTTDAPLSNHVASSNGTAKVVEVKPVSFRVIKLNEDDKKLPGAVFTIYKEVEEHAKDAVELTLENKSKVYGVKVVDMTQTDLNGEATINNLDAQGRYYVKETKAPDGYSLNDTAYELKGASATQNEDQTVNEGGVQYIKTTFTYTNFNDQTVVDTELSSLPSTGGIGTTIFTIGGCAIMVAAAGLFFASRRKANK